MGFSVALKEKIKQIDERLNHFTPNKITGVVCKITGFLVEGRGLTLSVGSLCEIIMPNQPPIRAQVVGFSNELTFLIPFKDIQGIKPGQAIIPKSTTLQVPVGKALLGRVLNGLGEPLDKKGPLLTNQYYPLHAKALNPIERQRIKKPLDVGIRAINSLLTVGLGQRLGIFAGTGVGKSILLGMITNFTEADVVIVGLIGERSREVKEFIEENLDKAHADRAIIIASPIDCSPLEHSNAALVATSIAEYFRDEGLKVLLIIDSLTRYAHALRKIYLTLGEPPSSRGYSPSVFNQVSQLVERAGNGTGEGSITAFYTVLTEGDDLFDPIADHARSVLDGHIVLSRKLAELSQYPAIDISASVSRVMTTITPEAHQAAASRFKKLFATYQSNAELINMGMYQAGTNALLDEALAKKDNMQALLTQGVHEACPFEASVVNLKEIMQP